MRRCTNAPRSRIFRRSFLAISSTPNKRKASDMPNSETLDHNELNCEELRVRFIGWLGDGVTIVAATRTQ